MHAVEMKGETEDEFRVERPTSSVSMMDKERKYENTLVALLFFSWGTVFLDRMSQHYLAPYYAPEFQLSHEQIGLLASVLAITWALSTLTFGALSDRIGRRPILIPAVFAFSLLSWLSGVVHNFNELLIVRALLGVAEGPAWSIMTALIEESSHPTRRGRNIGIVVSATALVGLAVAPVLTTQVAARYGWRWAFFVAGVPGFLLGMLIWKFVKEPERNTDPSLHGRPVSFGDFFSILRYRNTWLCCAGAVGFVSWLFLLNVFAPLYITEVAHQDARTMGYLMSASGLGSFFYAHLFPTLSDRVGRKPILLVTAAMCTMVPLTLLISPLYEHLWVLAAMLLLMNAGQGIAALILVLVPTESVPPQFAATAIGLATSAGEIFGAALMPTLAGALAERHGLALTMRMSAGGTALLFLAALLLKETAMARRGQAVVESGTAV